MSENTEKEMSVSAEETAKKKNQTSRTAIREMVFTAVFAAIIAVCSILSIPIGEVPVTLQTFAVCLSAAMLGWRRGFLAVVVYLLLGAVGVPVFAGMTGGLGILMGPTGGYLIGFLPAAIIIGLVAEKTNRRALPLTLAMVGGVLACYAFGTVWFMAVTGTGFVEALLLCVVPFLAFDAVKIAVAVILSNRLSKVVRL